MEVKCFSLNQRLLDQSEKNSWRQILRNSWRLPKAPSCWIMKISQCG